MHNAGTHAIVNWALSMGVGHAETAHSGTDTAGNHRLAAAAAAAMADDDEGFIDHEEGSSARCWSICMAA